MLAMLVPQSATAISSSCSSCPRPLRPPRFGTFSTAVTAGTNKHLRDLRALDAFRNPNKIPFLQAQAGREQNRPRRRRIPILIMLDAAAWFLLRFFTIVVLGVPLQSILKHPKSMDAPWVWSFWFRLPIVVGIGYGIFPWWCVTCNRIFSPSNDLASAVSIVFAPLATLLYAALAGYAVVSLWGRLEKVRSSLHKEFALLEILEKRIPEDNERLKKHFQDHVDGVEQYEVQRGTPAPSRFNHLAELAAAPELADGVAQQEIQSIAKVRAERRAAEDICFPTVVWASLRLLTVLLLTAFALLAGRSGAIPGRGERILFSLLVVVLFWVNHLCRDLVDLCGGDFQLDIDELRRDAGLFRHRWQR